MENQITKEAEAITEVETKVTIEDIMSDKSVEDTTEATEEIGREEEKSGIQKAKAGTPAWLQKKIDIATSEKKLAIEEARKLREKLTALETEKIVKSKPIPPLESNFDSSEDYLVAVDKYQDSIFEYNNTKLRTKQSEEEAEQRTKEVEEAFLRNSERMLNKYPDFDEVVDSTDFKGLDKIFIDHKLAPEISYYFCKNLDEIERVSGLSASGRGIEIGKLVERFSQAKPKRTNAPRPLSIVNSDTETVIVDITKIKNDDDWYRARTLEKTRKFKEK